MVFLVPGNGRAAATEQRLALRGFLGFKLHQLDQLLDVIAVDVVSVTIDLHFFFPGAVRLALSFNENGKVSSTLICGARPYAAEAALRSPDGSLTQAAVMIGRDSSQSTSARTATAPSPRKAAG